MDLASILDSLRVIGLPMRTKFRGINRREIALIHGPAGWGEFSPFLEYDSVESAPWLASAVAAAYKNPPEIHREEIAINGTIPALDERSAIEEVISWYPGATVFKVKVGGDLKSDLRRVETVVEAAPSAKLRIDVNGTWNVNQAVTALHQITLRYGELLQYIEQPVATIEELRELKARLDSEVKIAGDEVIRKARDPFSLDLAGAVDIVMLKVAPLGGIERSIKIAAHHNLPVVVSSALDSAVGIKHGLLLAAALPRLDFACGLATGALFQDDLANLTIEDGKIKLTDFQVLPEKIEQLAVSRERLEWWRKRIIDTWEVAS